jgi:hypothetical protein
VPVEQVEVAFADNCSDVTVEWVEDIIQGDCPNAYTSVRTCTLTDVCGNIATESYTLEVSDTEGPQIFGVPADTTLNCGEDLPVVDVFAVDNCTAQPEFILSESMETIGCTMIVTRRWTAIDECDNVTQNVQVVTYIDETLPIFSQYPDDLILICGTTLPEAPVLTAVDDCSGEVEVTFTEIVNSTDPCAPVERSWCAIDCSGNEACFTQLIIFEQPQAAVIQNQPEVRAWQNAGDEMLVSFTANVAGRWGLDLYDLNGRKVVNVFAGEMKAEKLLYLTDIEGLRRDVSRADSLISALTASELNELLNDGTIAGGMIPKAESCMEAVGLGVPAVHILDGRIAHVSIIELFTDAGIGTMVTKSDSTKVAKS